MSTELATPSLPKIKIFWKNYYGVIIYTHDTSSKVLSHESSYIVDELMWPNFGKSSISWKELIKTSFLSTFDNRNYFFWGVVSVQVQYFGTDTRYELETAQQSGKGAETESQNVLRANSYL